LQIELIQTRQEVEKRVTEKEEEFENTRKTHQRALESMQVCVCVCVCVCNDCIVNVQATVESESRARADLQRVRKKLETDINDFETQLESASKAQAEAAKNNKRLHDQIKDLQVYPSPIFEIKQ
jgi:septal ring factor EnvC (AmiA/AmiB activator)